MIHYAKHRIFIRWMINYLCWIEKQKSLVTLQEEPLTGFTLKAGHNTVKDPLFLVIVSIMNKTAGNTFLETLRITFIDNDGKFWPRTWQYFIIIKTAAFWKKPSNWSYCPTSLYVPQLTHNRMFHLPSIPSTQQRIVWIEEF